MADRQADMSEPFTVDCTVSYSATHDTIRLDHPSGIIGMETEARQRV